MNTKMTGLFQIQPRGSVNMSRGADSNAWKTRNAMEEQRRLFKKRLFGEHYNHTRVGLNKEKQYLLQQQKNTEIQRQNLILLQKIQQISSKMPLQNPKKRFNTQQEVTLEQNGITAITNNTKINRRRYQRTTSQSQDEQVKHSFSSFSAQKSARLSKKYLFKGGIETGGKRFEVRAYFEDDKYVIWISLGEAVQKIRVRREVYFEAYNNLLDKNHSNIANLLKFDGKFFELLQVESEFEIEKQMKLPTIEHRQAIKRKTEGNMEP